MKAFKILIAILFITTGVANAQFTKAELQVSGLTCSMCSKATEKSLRTLDFIGDVKADLNRNIFLITFKKDVPVSLDLISKKVQGSGFFVNNLKLYFNFNNVKVANNLFSYGGDSYYLLNNSTTPLDGSVPLTVVDKGFAPASVYKKYNQAADNKSTPGRTYHVTI